MVPPVREQQYVIECLVAFQQPLISEDFLCSLHGCLGGQLILGVFCACLGYPRLYLSADAQVCVVEFSETMSLTWCVSELRELRLKPRPFRAGRLRVALVQGIDTIFDHLHVAASCPVSAYPLIRLDPVLYLVEHVIQHFKIGLLGDALLCTQCPHADGWRKPTE